MTKRMLAPAIPKSTWPQDVKEHAQSPSPGPWDAQGARPVISLHIT